MRKGRARFAQVQQHGVVASAGGVLLCRGVRTVGGLGDAAGPRAVSVGLRC